jgi:hypothetical protein
MMGTRTPNIVQRIDDLRDGRGGGFGVHGDAHQLGAGARQRHHLIDGGSDVGGVRVGHGLDHDRIETGRRKGLKSPRVSCFVLSLNPCGRGGIGRRTGLKRKLECPPGNRRW